MWAPSTSASVRTMILWYRKLPTLKGSPLIPRPIPVMRFCTSLFLYIRASSFFSTFRILPRNGSTACVSRSRACLALPPALSPSTMNISDTAGSRLLQSASLPGRVELLSTDLDRARSRARLAASAAFAACWAFAITRSIICGCCWRYSPSSSLTDWSTMRRTSGLPSFVLVCPSNSGSGTFTETIAVSPSRMYSPLRFDSFSLSLFAARAEAFRTLVRQNLRPSMWDPPSMVRMLLANPRTRSE
mmetsp:Transcript_7774/g.13821  ORF Transcript_7774/g.13821 Transcript_7774/m.13821 type:complete len:245 (+) Transcript_7774:569-1303(+)